MNNNYNDIKNVELRTWNRCATFFNIARDSSLTKAKDYAKELDNPAKVQMNRMFEKIRDKGYEEVKRLVLTKGHIIGDC